MSDFYFDKIKNSGIKSKTVVFEGPDFSGKTTLIERLTRESKFGHHNYLQSRGWPTNIVYGDFYNRSPQNFWSEMETQLNSNKFIYLFLLPTEQEIIERSTRGDKYVDSAQSIELLKKYRELYSRLSERYFNVTQTDTIFDDIFHSKFSQYHPVVRDWLTLVKSLVGNSTPLYSYRFNYEFSRYQNSQLALELPSVYFDLENFLDQTSKLYLNPDYKKTYYKDVYDQEMLLNQLLFNSHIQLDVYGQDRNSRRFIATNNTSCLSLLDICIDNSNDIYVNATFRSSDVINLLLHDLSFIFSTTSKFIGFLNQYQYKKLKEIENPTIKYNITIANAHVVDFSKGTQK